MAAAIALLLALSAFGCLAMPPAGPASDVPPTSVPAATSTPTATGPEATQSQIEPPAASTTRARVVTVIDGDTIKVRVGGSVHTVRYIGIDAPERDEPLGPAATDANRTLVEAKIVYLERDISETDQFGRLLRYVFLPDGTFVNAEIVRQGLAQSKSYPPDVGRQETLDAAEQAAREAGRGLWE